MKQRKRNLLLILVLAMSLIFNTLGVFAAVPATTAENGQISILNPDNSGVSFKDATFNLYKVLDAKGTDRSKLTYSVDPAFLKYFESVISTSSSKPSFNVEVAKYIADLQGADNINLANALVGYATTGSNSVTPMDTATPNADVKEVIFPTKGGALEQGFYLVTVAAGGFTSVPMLVLVTDNQGSPVIIKASEPPIDKVIAGTTPSVVGDYQVGDVIPFEVTGYIPTNVKGYETYTYVLKDKMTNGLELDASTFKTKVNNIVIDGQYTTTTVSTTGFEQSFDIINGIENKAFKEGDKITITYNVTLTRDALVATGNVNELTLEFDKMPGATTTSSKKEVNVYTFDVDFRKDGLEGGVQSPLAGAQFELAAKSTSDSAIYFTTSSEVVIDSTEKTVYTVCDQTHAHGTGCTTVIESPDTGLFNIKGLKAIEYILTETEAPDGFNIADPIEISITATYEGGKLKEHVVTVDGEVYTSETATIVNKAGQELPGTGSFGTKAFTIIGSTMMLGAAVLFITKRRYNANQD